MWVDLLLVLLAMVLIASYLGMDQREGKLLYD